MKKTLLKIIEDNFNNYMLQENLKHDIEWGMASGDIYKMIDHVLKKSANEFYSQK